MKHLLVAILILFAIAVQTGHSEEDGLVLTTIKIDQFARLDKGKLIIDIPHGKESEAKYSEFRFDATPYAGSHSIGAITGRFTGELLTGNPPVEVFVHLAYPALDGSHERTGGGKSNNLRDHSFPLSITFDPYVKHCLLRIGLKGCAGQMEFDLDSLKFETLFSRDESDWQCTYSDAVKNRPIHRGVMSSGVDQENENNFVELKKWNVNLMRLQLNCSEDWALNHPDKYQRFIDEKIEKTIPNVLKLAARYDVKVIIDLHMVPGGNRMNDTQDGIYSSDRSAEKFYEIWRRIAFKFKDNPALYGYDLMNEPKQYRRAKYNYWDLQRVAAEEIRKIDPETPIYVHSNMMGSPLTFYYLKPLQLKNIIYQIHFYEPFDFTHYFIHKQADLDSGKLQYRTFPGMYYGTMWSDDLIEFRKKLAYVLDFQKRHNALIFVGEFSAPTYAPGADKYLACCIRIFEEYGWDWTYHAFREAKVWDLEYDGTAIDNLKKAAHTSRKEVLLNAFKNNINEGARQ